MEPHQLLHERQADAGALVRACARTANASKALEQERHFSVGNAGPGIGDGETHGIPKAGQRHRDAPVERELQRIRQQVEDDLLPHQAIDVDGPAGGSTVDIEAQARSLHRRSERAGEVGGEDIELDRLVDRIGASRFNS
jgi:hypothetical protein